MIASIGRNRLAALTCAAIAASLFAVTLGFEEVPESISRGFGAELFPRLVLGVIFLMSVALALGKDDAREPDAPTTWRVFAAGALLGGFMGALEIIGMLPAMAVFLIAAGWLWGERRIGWLAVSSALVTFSIWAVFVKGFGIPLPFGMVGRWAGY